MARRHTCDVPGCDAPRKRWQRLCERCLTRLPGDIRTEIIAAHRGHRRNDWRRACKRAADHLTALSAPDRAERSHAPKPHRLTAEQAFDLNQRLLGER